jgi:transposase
MSDVTVCAPRSRRATRQLWAERVARFPDSGLSVAAFCSAEGVSTNSFFYWKRQFQTAAPDASTATPARLLAVQVPASPAPVEVVLPGGTVLRLAPGCDLALVRSLLATLAGAPC